jgi:hypothetical protein
MTSYRARGVAALALALGCAAPRALALQQVGGGRVQDRSVFVSSNVLTPGEADDWPLTARENETVILSVESGRFDPLVELLSPAGAVIAQNDDVRPGEQRAMLLAALPSAGEYKVRVTASKGASGGEYRLTIRRFVASETPLGARTASALGPDLAGWHRFRAEQGQTLVVTARATAFSPEIEILTPDGEPLAASSSQPGEGVARSAFRALRAGAYHARVAAEGGSGAPRESYALTVATARTFPFEVGAAETSRRVDAGGLDLWAFDAEAGEVVRVTARSAGVGMQLALSYVPPLDDAGQPRLPPGNLQPVAFLPSDPKAGGEVTAVLNVKGRYQAEVSQPLGLAADYTFTASRPVRPLAPGVQAKGALALGASDYWVVEAGAASIVRVDASSEQFDAMTELYGPRGEQVAVNDDGGSGRNALLTALVVEPGRYLLRVSAFGDGASGAYAVRIVPDVVKRIALGARVEGTVGAGASEVWSFEGRAGQTVILSARSSEVDTQLALYGPDAIPLAVDDDGGEGADSLVAVRLPADGTYTAWVSAKAGAGAYSLRLIDAE